MSASQYDRTLETSEDHPAFSYLSSACRWASNGYYKMLQFYTVSRATSVTSASDSSSNLLPIQYLQLRAH